MLEQVIRGKPRSDLPARDDRRMFVAGIERVGFPRLADQAVHGLGRSLSGDQLDEVAKAARHHR